MLSNDAITALKRPRNQAVEGRPEIYRALREDDAESDIRRALRELPDEKEGTKAMRRINSISINGTEMFHFVRGLPVLARRNDTAAANAFEQRVAQMLLSPIRTNAAGAAVLAEINATGRGLTISPMIGIRNAFAFAASPGQLTLANLQQAERASTAHGQTVFRNRPNPALMEPGDDPMTLAIEAVRPVRGLGTGSEARVFMPSESIPIPGTSPGQVLVHELVHAIRIMKGHSAAAPTHDAYDNDEEFIAIVVEGIFLSVGGSPIVRVAHSLPPLMRGILRSVGGLGIADNPFRQMNGGNSSSSVTPAQTFARTYHRQLQTFAIRERSLVSRLGQIRCGFNPLREYLIGVGAIPH